jgi:hypothetical protein
MFPSRIWVFAAGMATFVSSPSVGEPQQAPDLPPGPGLELIQRSCVGCHDIYMITTKRKTPDQWATTVGLMADRGAEITPDEMQIIEEYLSQNFSTATGTAAAQ